MNRYNNSMLRQVWSLPELIEQQYEDLEPKTRSILTFQEIFNIQRIILTGCGDSFAACMSEKYAFEKLTGIPTEAVPALELARFYDRKQLGFDVRNPLVIAVSNSGNVSRVGEAVMRARDAGSYVLAVTGNMDSLLAKNSDKILKLDIPSFDPAPGTRSYMVSVMALLFLAIRFGEVRHRYTMDEAMDMRFDIRDQGKALRETLPEMEEKTEPLAESWKDMPYFEFSGAGADYAAAWFGSAKILEATGRFSSAVSVEDWFHLNYFVRNIDEAPVLLCTMKENLAWSRAEELIAMCHDMKRPLAVVTNDTELLLPGKVTMITAPWAQYKQSCAVTEFVPFCMFAGVLKELLGEEYGRGSKGRWAGSRDGKSVNSSRIVMV